MGHKQNAAGEALQISFQPADHLRVQVVGRFVQQQKIARMYQTGGQGHPLPLSAGQGPHFLPHIRNAQPGQYLHSLIPGNFPGRGVQPCLHLLHDRILRVIVRVLRQIAQAHIGVITDAAGIRLFLPRRQPQEGGLTAAVDADHAHPVPLLHIKRHIIQKRPIPVGLADALHVQKHSPDSFHGFRLL